VHLQQQTRVCHYHADLIARQQNITLSYADKRYLLIGEGSQLNGTPSHRMLFCFLHHLASTVCHPKLGLQQGGPGKCERCIPAKKSLLP